MAGHAKTLNPRQALFCQYVVGTGNGDGMSYADAARKAGYKDSPYLPETAGQLIHRPIIKAELQRLTTLARATLNLNAATWQRELLDRYLHIKQDGSDGDALRALELWGKHLGLLDTKRQDESADEAKQVLAAFAAIVARSQPRPELPASIEGSYRAIASAPAPTRVATEAHAPARDDARAREG